MNINFDYGHGVGECKMKSRWHGCCCQCVYHAEVFAHCCHSPRSTGQCVCSNSLGFFICTCFMSFPARANLCGEHGFCEMYECRTEKEGAVANSLQQLKAEIRSLRDYMRERNHGALSKTDRAYILNRLSELSAV